MPPSIVRHEYVADKESQRLRREKAEHDLAFRKARTQHELIRKMEREMKLAQDRDELIEKSLVEKQAAYLVITLRQRILSIPQTYARRILGLTDASQASRILKEMAVAVLNDIKDLPQQVTDPNWMETLEAEENGNGQTGPPKAKAASRRKR
jgi:hypothetical protein